MARGAGAPAGARALSTRRCYEELLGIAEGAIVSPEEIVVANHYTDLRDLDPDPRDAGSPRRRSDAPDIDAPRAPAPRPRRRRLQHALGRVADGAHPRADLGHARDGDPVRHGARVPESEDGPAATLLTVTGCLGMAGMNAARVGIAINNLFSTDATLGIVWPAMVRRALHQDTAAAARDVIAASPIGSGHHYFVADRNDAFALEASGTRRKLVFGGGPVLLPHQPLPRRATSPRARRSRRRARRTTA